MGQEGGPPRISERLFEAGETSVIIRPWEIVLEYPPPDVEDNVGTYHVMHDLFGLSVGVSRYFSHGERRGFALILPNSFVVSVDILPGMGVDLVDAGCSIARCDTYEGLKTPEYPIFWGDVAVGEDRETFSWRVHDHTTLIDLVMRAGEMPNPYRKGDCRE